MFHRQIKKKQVRAHPVKDGPRSGIPAEGHPVTNHESFTHSVLYAGAHQWRGVTAHFLHGRTPRHPAMKPHEHTNGDINGHLQRGSDIRPPMRDKNV